MNLQLNEKQLNELSSDTGPLDESGEKERARYFSFAVISNSHSQYYNGKKEVKQYCFYIRKQLLISFTSHLQLMEKSTHRKMFAQYTRRKTFK